MAQMDEVPFTPSTNNSTHSRINNIECKNYYQVLSSQNKEIQRTHENAQLSPKALTVKIKSPVQNT